MTGPYRVNVYLGKSARDIRAATAPDLRLRWKSDGGDGVLDAGCDMCWRFYRSGNGAGQVGTLRAAVFAVGAMLAVGEEAHVEITGKVAGERQVVHGEDVLRLSETQIVSPLGTKWGRERIWNGV